VSPDGSPKTILLAEDEWRVRSFVLTLLQESGYNVVVAVDGIDALERAREHKGEIHLLLSNIQMPRMTGIELATQLRIERPDTGILLISGLDAGMLVLNHGWQFLPKPFMPQMLKQKIESMLKDQPESGRDISDFGSPAE
jgi:two-component system, cell cycle sensor histidine kinase and response regulator CckA